MQTRSQINKIVGKNIRTAREAAGISQSALGEVCGISYQAISKYERGVNSIDIPRAVLMAERLGVSIMDIMVGVEDIGRVLERHAINFIKRQLQRAS